MKRWYDNLWRQMLHQVLRKMAITGRIGCLILSCSSSCCPFHWWSITLECLRVHIICFLISFAESIVITSAKPWVMSFHTSLLSIKRRDVAPFWLPLFRPRRRSSFSVFLFMGVMGILLPSSRICFLIVHIGWSWRRSLKSSGCLNSDPYWGWVSCVALCCDF